MVNCSLLANIFNILFLIFKTQQQMFTEKSIHNLNHINSVKQIHILIKESLRTVY